MASSDRARRLGILLAIGALPLSAGCNREEEPGPATEGNERARIIVEPPETEEDELPASFSWRDSEALPPVGDQGLSPSCVAWATCYATSFRLAHYLHTDWKPAEETKERLGPAYLYNLALQHDKGTGLGVEVSSAEGIHFFKAFGILTEFGASTEAQMPYTVDFQRNATQDAMDEAAGLRKDLHCVTKGWTLLSASGGDDWEDAIKRHIVDVGPMPLLIKAYSDFVRCGVGEDYAGPEGGADYLGKHALLCVGFDDGHVRVSNGIEAPSFLFMNSWGKSWGDEGFVWIPYQRIRKSDGGLVAEAWVADEPTALLEDPPAATLTFPEEWVENPSPEVWDAELFDQCSTSEFVRTDEELEDVEVDVTSEEITIRSPTVPLVPALVGGGAMRFVDERVAGDPQTYRLERIGPDPDAVGVWQEVATLQIRNRTTAPERIDFRVEVRDRLGRVRRTKRVRVRRR